MATINPTVNAVGAHRGICVWVLGSGDDGAYVNDATYSWRSIQSTNAYTVYQSNDGVTWDHILSSTSSFPGSVAVYEIPGKAAAIRVVDGGGAGSTITMWGVTN